MPSRSGASLYGVVDEPDADQILTIDELRSLRDRMGAEAAAPAPVTGAAGFEIPDPPPGVPLQAQPDPWEDLRRRATGQRRWGGFRWGKPLAIAGCLAVAGGGVAALLMTGHTRTDPPPSVKVSTPVTPALTSAPVSVVLTPEPAIVPPVPTVPESTAPAPIVPAPSPPAEDTTTEPPTAAVPPPRATYRPKPPTAAKSPAARPAPAGVPERPPAAAPEQAGNASAAPEPQPTLSRTPTSWSPAAPG